MSVFDIDAIQTLPEPQKYFEILCEKEFGFNLTTGSIYNPGFYGVKLAWIIRELRTKYPGQYIRCCRKGYGQMEISTENPSKP